MKLWQKIGVLSLVFFLAVYFGACILIIEQNAGAAFRRTLRRAADEQASISSGMLRYADKNLRKDYYDEERYLEYAGEYLESRVNSQGLYLEVQSGEHLIYSNFEAGFETFRAAPENYYAVMQYTTLEKENKRYLRLIHRISGGEHEFLSTYLTDITEIYLNRNEQYLFFIKLSLAVSLILILGLYLILNHSMKPIRTLTNSIKKVENGDFRERILLTGSDEIGELADSYNRMAEAIDNQIRQLRLKNQEQQRFIDNFTHELRTPLTAVVGYADLIRSTAGEEDYYQELGERIFREGKRIERLSELMMKLAFLKHTQVELIRENLCDILRAAKQTMIPSFRQAQIDLKLDLPAEAVYVHGDRELLQTLFLNLLDNAAKASAAGAQVLVRLENRADGIFVRVIDHGTGIAEAELDKVFEMFYQADQARSGRRGFGAGLSICRDIAGLHQARIELASREGEGTTVTIFFPCYKDDTK